MNKHYLQCAGRCYFEKKDKATGVTHASKSQNNQYLSLSLSRPVVSMIVFQTFFCRMNE